MKHSIIPLLFFILSTQIGFAQEEIKFTSVKSTEDYQEVLGKARAEDKMLLVALVDDEDIYWKQMQNEDLFKKSSVLPVLQGYKGIEIEISSKMGQVWIELFPVEELPAFYFLNNEEILLDLLLGYQADTSIMVSAKQAQKDRHLYTQLSDKFTSGKLVAGEWNKLLEIHAKNFTYYETQKLAIDYLNGLENNELLKKEVLPILLQYGTNLESRYPNIVFKNRKVIESRLPEFEFMDYFSTVYSYNLDKAMINRDSTLLLKLVQQVLPQNPDTSVNTRDLIFETQKLYIEETKQYSIWADAALEYYKNEEVDSLKAEMLFNEGFYLADTYNNKSALRAARKLAREANNLHESFRSKMLEGYMAYLLKDYDAAEVLVNKANNITKNPNNKKKAEGLLKMITAAKVKR